MTDQKQVVSQEQSNFNWRAGYNTNSIFRQKVNERIIKDLVDPPASAKIAEETLVEKLKHIINLKLAVSEHFVQSEKVGFSKYGPDFVGDPLTHAQMELRDTLLYLYTELYSIQNTQFESPHLIAELKITIGLARQAFHRVMNLIEVKKTI